MDNDHRGAGHRLGRLTDLLLRELRDLFDDEVEDPALHGVTVYAVTLSVDYKNAKVHVGLRPGVPVDRAKSALVRVTPFLRRRLSDAVALKRTPDLRFVVDATAPADPGEEDPWSG